MREIPAVDSIGYLDGDYREGGGDYEVREYVLPCNCFVFPVAGCGYATFSGDGSLSGYDQYGMPSA